VKILLPSDKNKTLVLIQNGCCCLKAADGSRLTGR
jgi:hypothetical protein